MSRIINLEKLTQQVRRDILRMVHSVNSGHPGGSLGCAEFFVALYNGILDLNDGFDMDQVWRQLPKDTPKLDVWARDGVHPGKVPHDMFAKALIDHLEGKKLADPVLDILKNPQF